MGKNNLKLIKYIFVTSIVFFIAIGLDITPYLRGPGIYPPEWRWEYYFVNTLPKIWLPLIVASFIGGIIYMVEQKKEAEFKSKEKIILSTLVVLGFLFQISVLHFSRAGIPVLIHRIINPELNGYFTTAIQIKDVGVFLNTYNDSVLNFNMHAKGHMPLAVLFFSGINFFSSFLTFLYPLIEKLDPNHSDVRIIWESLLLNEKLGTIIANLLIPFLSSSVIFPLYFVGKQLYGIKSAFRTVFLYLVTPSIVLFVPINDVFLPLFPVISLFLFYKSLASKSIFFIVLSGVVMSLGLLFSLSLLPFLFLFFIIFLLVALNKKNQLINSNNLKLGTSFIVGLVFIPILLFIFFNFNFLEVSKTLMSGLPLERKYTVWIFYNLYDFFIFSGIPILIIFMRMLWQFKNTHILQVDKLSLAFILMIGLLNFSGSVRGEVARIWIPYIPILILIVSNFITNKVKFSRRLFLAIFFFQVLQTLVFQEFLVTLW